MPKLITLLLGLVLAGCGRADDAVVVFAAASVGDAVEAIGEQYEAETGRAVRVHSAASSMLARQIEAGARADVVVLANAEWMDRLQEAELIDSASRRNLLHNSLVVVVPIDDEREVDLAGQADGLGRSIAIGDPAHVPVGRYAEQALRGLGWWDAAEPNVVPAGDARAALRYVELGEVDSGIVYATDAAASERVRIAAEIPGGLHDPVVYPAAVTPDGDAAFLGYLQTQTARGTFERAGFVVTP